MAILSGKKADKSKEAQPFWTWQRIGAAITFLYAVLAILLGFVDVEFFKKFADLEPNAIGDALAGFFAPLAFLWLFIATMIQGQELADNRKVMEQQAEAAKQQAEFLKNQHDAMEVQNKLANQVAIANHQFALFDKRMEFFELMNKISYEAFSVGGVTYDIRVNIIRAKQKSRWLFDDKIDQWLKEVYSLAHDAYFYEKRRQNELRIQRERPDKWTDEQEENVDGLFNRVSDAMEKLEVMIDPIEIERILSEYLKIPARIEPYEISIKEAEQR